MSNLWMLEEIPTPAEAARRVALREKERRRRMGLSQAALAERSGVSLGALRRFEQTGAIAFESLVRICRALGCEDELGGLFSKPAYRSIEEVVDERKRKG